MIRQVLFLCTANYYRSRFAEHVFNWLAEREGLRWRADSCGLVVVRWDDDDVGVISPDVVEALRARDIPVNGDHRRPRQVTHDDLAKSQLVIALKEAEHRLLLGYQFPDWADRVEYWHVDDVDCAPPDEALPVLEQHVRDLASRLLGAARGTGECGAEE
jgi:protein-tyrosine-phosphatase